MNGNAPSHYILPDIEAPNIVSLKIKKDDIWKMTEAVVMGITNRAQSLLEKYKDPAPTMAHLFHIANPNHPDPNSKIIQYLLSGPFTVLYF